MSGDKPVGPGASAQPVASGLEALLPRLRPQLRAILNTWRIPPADSEDLVQATLTIAVEKWQHIDKPEPWILAAEPSTAALAALRRFLLWAGHRRLHALRPNAVRQALRAYSGQRRPPVPAARRPLIPTEGDHPFQSEGDHF